MDFNEVYSDTVSSVSHAVLLDDPILLKKLVEEKRLSSSGHDNRGWYAIHHAAKIGSVKCLDILTQLEECNVNWQSHEGETALYIACKNQQFDTVRLLIARSSDVNQGTLHGTTPLHISAKNGNLQIVKYLVEHMADLKAVDNAQETVLHYIVDNKDSTNQAHDECLRYLLEQKCVDISFPNAMEATPLHVAIVRKRVDLANLLIDHARKVEEHRVELIDTPDCGKMTPLMLAIYGKHVALSETLLDMGANPNAIIVSDNRIDNNLMPIHIACMANLPEMINRLIPITNVSIIKNSLRYSSDKACMYRICHENLPESLVSLERLLSFLKADDFITYFEGGLPSDYPSDDNDEMEDLAPTIPPAFWHVADPQAIFPFSGETPLTHYLRNDWHWALENGGKESLSALKFVKNYVENGSSVNEFSVDPDSEKFTLPPLSALCCTRKPLKFTPSIIHLVEEIVDYLIEQGAVLPKHALTFICLSAHPVILKILCDYGAIVVEDFDITFLLNNFKRLIHLPNVLLGTSVNHSLPLFYSLYFYGCSRNPNLEHYQTVYPFLEKLFNEYYIFDEKLNRSNADLIKDISLLKLCRITIRKHLHLHRILPNQNINKLILRLPGLPVDLYDFLCLKSLRIRKIKNSK